MTPRLMIRLSLAACLFFGANVLLWGGVSPAWVMQGVGCGLLALVLLDLAVRYHVNTTFGLLMLAGIFAIAASVLLMPHVTLIDMPRTFLTRALGAQTAVALVALWLFKRMIHQRPPHLVMILIGVVWGIWGHYSPFIATPTDLAPLLMSAIPVLMLILFATRRAHPLAADALLLTPRQWQGVALALVALVAIQAAHQALDALALIVAASLIAFLVVMLWFQRNKRRQPFVVAVNADAAPLVKHVITLCLFIGGALVGYHLPPTLTDLIGVAFTAFGVVWLPSLALVMGASAFAQQMRTHQL